MNNILIWLECWGKVAENGDRLWRYGKEIKGNITSVRAEEKIRRKRRKSKINCIVNTKGIINWNEDCACNEHNRAEKFFSKAYWINSLE